MQKLSTSSRRKYSQTPKGLFYQNFRYHETKIFDRKSWYLRLYKKIFDTRNFQKHWKVRIHFFGTVRRKKFHEKSWYPVSHSFSIPKTFRNNKKTTWQIFSCTQKIFELFSKYPFYGSPKVSYPTNGLPQKRPEAREVSRNSKRAPLLTFRYYDCETKSFRHFLVIPTYRLPKLSRQTGGRRQLWRVLNLF